MTNYQNSEFSFSQQVKPFRKSIDKMIAAGVGPTELTRKLIARGVRSPHTAEQKAQNGGRDLYDPLHPLELARVIANVRRYCYGYIPKPKPKPKPKKHRRRGGQAGLGDLRDTVLVWTPETQYKELNREL